MGRDYGDVMPRRMTEVDQRAGILRARVTAFDDRVKPVEAFDAAGLPVRRAEADPADAHPWSTRSETFDASGLTVEWSIVHDDGVEQIRAEDDGVNVTTHDGAGGLAVPV